MAKIKTFIPPARGVRPSAMGFKNTVFVSPNDDLTAKYNWLKSSDRDSKMGALSATNRRVLILLPGTHTLTATLTFDTNYVDIFSLSGNPLDTVVTRGTGGVTVTQTADSLHLSSFTIENTGNVGGDRGFTVNPISANTDSVYEYMHFRQPNALTDTESVYLLKDNDGLWEFCQGDDYSWRVDDNVDLGGEFNYCLAGDSSFAGDASGASLSATMRYCTAGIQSFGGCGSYGCDITVDAFLLRCVAGNNSYATGKEFAGRAVNCIGGRNCFAGTTNPGFPSTFSGIAENCICEGGRCFGMGNASSEQSGQIVNCRTSTAGMYSTGFLDSREGTVVDNSAAATLTTDLSGDNNDLLFMYKKANTEGNYLGIKYTSFIFALVTVSELTGANAGITQIEVKYTAGANTATDIKNQIEGDADASALVTVANAPGNDGTGAVTNMPLTLLSGGVDPPSFSNNHPFTPTACTEDTTVAPFDNGHTYTNEGVSGLITWSLPAAKAGMKYTFCRTDFAAGEDIHIDPNGTEHIYQSDGTDCGAGKYYGSDPAVDAYAGVVLECRKDGEWRVVRELGTWTAEA